MCRIIVVLTIVILYATFMVGVDRMVEAMEETSNTVPRSLCAMVSALFGSSRNFGRAVATSAWIIVGLHSAEAMYVFHQGTTVLKLNQESVMFWYLLVTMTGYPVTLEFLDLLKIQRECKANKKKL